MPLRKIPFSKFQEFHTFFNGDNAAIFDICSKCGGSCEYSKIGTLLPGEKEFLAQTMSMDVGIFEDTYLDGIRFGDDILLDVVKLNGPCPFLNKQTFACDCKPFKVILCEIYPICFQIRDNTVHYFLDECCQITKSKELRAYFLENGISLIKKLGIPFEWLKAVEIYDSLDFDYQSLIQERNTSKYQIWDIGTIMHHALNVPE